MAAFDQNEVANQVYQDHFGRAPSTRNLETIHPKEIPEADLWWMSPPCSPFTVRGRREDDLDPRARPFLNLIEAIETAGPPALFVENVQGFSGSRVHERLLGTLDRGRYEVQEQDLCLTDFGIPMRRPRHFILAARGGFRLETPAPPAKNFAGLVDLLETHPSPSLDVPVEFLARYGANLDIVDPAEEGAVLSCVTRAYARSHVKSGSYIRTANGGARRLSPEEILKFLGFPAEFRFPDQVSVSARYRLAGNSVDVRAIRFLLDRLGRVEAKMSR